MMKHLRRNIDACRKKKLFFFVSSDDTLEKKRAAASEVKCVHSEKKLFKSLSNSVVARVDELRLARRSDSTLKVACSYQHNVASISNIEKKKVPLPPTLFGHVSLCASAAWWLKISECP
jgi:hypothetical protein